MTDALFIDFETRSKADLSAVGGYNYVHDDSTELLCVAALLVDLTTGEPVQGWAWHEAPELGTRDLLWQPPRAWDALDGCPVTTSVAWDDLETLAADGVPFVAHNAIGFDIYVWQCLGLHPAHWVDSLQRARRRSLPGALDKLGAELYGVGKSEGAAMLKLLCAPNQRTGEFVPPSKDTISALLQYCLDDAVLLACAWLDELGRGIEPPWELELQEIDKQINQRGAWFDPELANALLRANRELRAKEAAVVAEDTEGEVTEETLRSEAKMRAWLRQHGMDTESFTEDVCKAIIRHPHTPDIVRRVMWARIGANKTAPGKLEKGLQIRCSDGRVRETLAYYGAFTGRWGGRAVQPHNLPRPNEDVDIHATVDGLLAGRGAAAIMDAARQAGCPPDEVIATCVRPTLAAEPGSYLAIADYSAIEARVCCWLAGDEDGLDVYREGLDPYIVMASHLYGREYQAIKQGKEEGDPESKLQRAAGKVGTLGCQYQMGAERCADFAAGLGINLARAGITPQEVVEGFRDLHPVIAGRRTGKVWEGHVLRKGGLWKALQRGVWDVVGRRDWSTVIGRCAWYRHGADLICTLPSGRYLRYRNARIEDVVPSWGGDPRPTVTYDHVRGSGVTRAATYGGKLCENITQAIARDVMAQAIVRLYKAGYDVVLHVHDEIVVETQDPNELQDIVDIMVEPPDWSGGLPLGVDGHVSQRFAKEPDPGMPTAERTAELPA